MLEAAFGSLAAERVLLFLQRYEKAYGRQIALAFDMPVSQVQKQLRKLEGGGLLVSEMVGRTRVYRWNPRSAFVAPLRGLLQSMLENLPPEQRAPYTDGRRRPRRAGKPG
ncbi:MAG: winged helix-turn-helix transcriptional regulator [Gammaproteobacteria bacterium]|nr:winged helix-turn-helix transcriptional regulator [Gammaproteobacteria bacterium]